MMADFELACTVDGCDYAGAFRLGAGDSSTYLGWMREEHPNHPRNHSAGPRNVKPKEQDLEMELGRDGELNF
ncbi:hypothetical protein [Pseudarthrobacter sp. NamE5]|uniref:hypothetical protein n=1 Tax=Pseudarthrobacter sp. NamE5 TaxID=2576839 RepID=UPI00110A8203|nr:hypothetical protein [Pseudarthrobacter sp. NamE5]